MANDYPTNETNSRHEEIARRAYELWEQEGRPHGTHERHWLNAERQVLGLAVSSGEPLLRAEPAKEGNPAYPSLSARDVMVEQNARNPVRVHPIPGRAAH
ncbi:MAG: DUF2934 domain-containing protein [Opitutaceae bacterium]|nr:DUF2934 domain-containing protein [Opitutaceae bacterium]